MIAGAVIGAVGIDVAGHAAAAVALGGALLAMMRLRSPFSSLAEAERKMVE
jgi:hypothetical protein